MFLNTLKRQSLGPIPADKVLRGTPVADALSHHVRCLLSQLGPQERRPCLHFIRVGNDPASALYVRKKEQAAQQTGIQSHTHTLPATLTQEALLQHIAQLNAADEVHGILVQMPLPAQIDPKAVASHMDPAKDVDGFHPLNLGKLCQGDPSGLVPCTPLGIQYLLQFYGIHTQGRHLCVVGRSTTVGLPASILALQKGPWANATVTVCHSGTQDLPSYTRQADILIVAAGKPGLLDAKAIKPGAIVIDVGIHRQQNPEGKAQLIGDVRVDEAFLSKVGAYTPVPGGVGPLTVASLMTNVLQAWVQQQQTLGRLRLPVGSGHAT